MGQEVTLLQLHLKWSGFWAALTLLREPRVREAGAEKEEGFRSTVFVQKGESSGHSGLGCLTEVPQEPRGDVGLGFAGLSG